jgi:hypothetical protein
MRRQKAQISKIKNYNREIIRNTKKIHRIIRDCFENLYSNKLVNLEEMDEFVDNYGYPKLNQEDINHINRSITCNEIETPIVFQKRKVQDLTDSQLNSIRHSKKN